MLPHDLHFIIISFLYCLKEQSDYCSAFNVCIKNVAKSCIINLQNQEDLEIFLSIPFPDYTKIEGIHIHYYLNDVEYNLLEKFLKIKKIRGKFLRTSFIWKGHRLIQTSGLSSLFDFSHIHVFPHRSNFYWHINVLTNVFKNINDHHLTLELYGGFLSNDIYGVDSISFVDKIILNKVTINYSYCLESLKTKTSCLKIIEK